MNPSIRSSSPIIRFSNLEARWSSLVLRTLVFPSNWLVIVSHASLAGLEPIQVNDREYSSQCFIFEFRSCLIWVSPSVCWFWRPSLIFHKHGGGRPTFFYSSPSIFINFSDNMSHFRLPMSKVATIKHDRLCTVTSSFMISMKSAGSQLVSSIWYHRDFPLWYQMKVQRQPSKKTHKRFQEHFLVLLETI